MKYRGDKTLGASVIYEAFYIAFKNHFILADHKSIKMYTGLLI